MGVFNISLVAPTLLLKDAIAREKKEASPCGKLQNNSHKETPISSFDAKSRVTSRRNLFYGGQISWIHNLR